MQEPNRLIPSVPTVVNVAGGLLEGFNLRPAVTGHATGVHDA